MTPAAPATAKMITMTPPAIGCDVVPLVPPDVGEVVPVVDDVGGGVVVVNPVGVVGVVGVVSPSTVTTTESWTEFPLVSVRVMT